MWKKSDNILNRLFDRQISAAPPSAHIQRDRLLYENIFPNYNVYDVDCPDHRFRKFTSDGQYLICFSRNYQNLIVYRYNCLNYCSRGENIEEFPSKGRKFGSYFSQLCLVNLGSGNEMICKDVCLVTDCNVYGIFATATSLDTDASERPGALLGIPSMEKIRFYLIRLADGTIMDERTFNHDFIHLTQNVGIFMYDDLVSILSVRYQTLHILQLRKSGKFVDVQSIGPYCKEDDELTLHSHAQKEAIFMTRSCKGKIQSLSEEVFLAQVSMPNYQDKHAKEYKNSHANVSSETYHEHRIAESLFSESEESFHGYFTIGQQSYSHTDSSASSLNHFPLGTGIAEVGSSRTYSRFYSNSRQLLEAPEIGPISGISNEHQTKRNENPYLNISRDTVSNDEYRDRSQLRIINQNSIQPSAERPVEYVISRREESHHQHLVQPNARVSNIVISDAQVRSTTHEMIQSHTTPILSHDSSNRNIALHMLSSLTHITVNRERTSGRSTVSSTGGFTNQLPSQSNLLHESSHNNTEKDRMLGGLKQRLLSYIFRNVGIEDNDTVSKSRHLKRFFYDFQDYADLVMWKVQFLDRDHLLIKFGSVDGVISQNIDTSHQTFFFAIYNIKSTEIVAFFQNSSEELFRLVEQYYDHFRVVPLYPSYTRFISSYSNNKYAREYFRRQKAACNKIKPSGYSQVVRRTLSSIPCNAQSHSPSPYFDQYLFQFDEKLISSLDQYKLCAEHPIKFMSRRKPGTTKFKIDPGLEYAPGDNHAKKLASFIFHPIFPFAISIQQAYVQPAVVNFHIRR